MTVTVAPERARYCVVALFDSLNSGHRFERREWPAHVTLAANFVASTSADEVVAAGLGGPAMEHAVSVRLGEPAPFGHEGEIPVLLVDSPQVEHVHRELVDRLERLEGFAPDEPAFWRDGYRPHVTLGPRVRAAEGDIRTVTQIAVARLTQATAEIIAGLDLTPPPRPPACAIGFDLDGTLFDHRGSAAEAVLEFTADLGYEPTPDRTAAWFDFEAEHFESWRAGAVTFTEQRRLRLRDYLRLLGARGLTEDGDLDRLFESYLTRYRRAWRAFPGVTSVLRQLRDQGMRIDVLTNGNHEQQIDKLRVTGLASLVDVVCTSEDIGVAKPDPRAFEILASRLGCTPSEMLFIGDDLTLDVTAARAAGVAAAQVRRDRDGPTALGEAVRSATL